MIHTTPTFIQLKAFNLNFLDQKVEQMVLAGHCHSSDGVTRKNSPLKAL